MADPADPDSNDGQEKPTDATPGEGEGKKTPPLPNSVSFDEGPNSTPLEEGSTQGAPPVTPLVERTSSWASPTPPQPSQGGASDVSLASTREQLPKEIPPPLTEVVPIPDDTDKDTGIAWCHLVPVKCSPPMAPITISVPSLSMGLIKRQPQPRSARDKSLIRIGSARDPLGPHAYIESLSTGVVITINDVTVPKNSKCPLANGDELAFQVGSVTNVFTVLVNHEALVAMLTQRKEKLRDRPTPPPEEGKGRRRVLSEQPQPQPQPPAQSQPLALTLPQQESCPMCSTTLLGWFKVCPGCAAPVQASAQKPKNMQCLMCHKFTGGAALCHVCNYANVPPNLPVQPPVRAPPVLPAPSTSLRPLATEQSPDQDLASAREALQKAYAMRQADRPVPVPPKKKRKTESEPKAPTERTGASTAAKPATKVADNFLLSDDGKQCISKAVTELSSFVVSPEDNTVLLDGTFPYYLDTTERQQVQHALFLNLTENRKVRCLDSVPKTLGLRVDSAACDIKCEMVLKGMAKELGCFFLAFDPPMLRCAGGTPSPLQQLDLHATQPYSLRENKGHVPKTSGAPTLQAPFIAGGSHVYVVGDRVTYQPSAEGGPCAKGAKGRVIITFPDNSSSKRVGVCFDVPQTNGTDLGGACSQGKGLFIDPVDLRPDSNDMCRVALHALFEVMESYQPLIVYIRGAAGRYLLSNHNSYKTLKDLVAKQMSKVCIGMSLVKQQASPKKHAAAKEAVPQATAVKDSKSKKHQQPVPQKPDTTPTYAELLPNAIDLALRPEGQERTAFKSATLSMWKNRLDTDKVFLRLKANILLVQQLLHENHLRCDALRDMCSRLKEMRHEEYQLTAFDQLGPAVKMLDLEPSHVQQALSWAVAHHLQKYKTLKLTQEGSQRLLLNLDDICHGIALFGKNYKHLQDKARRGAFDGLELDNEYETKLLGDVIPAGSVQVSFKDIGALHKVKEVLREVVLQPLQRPGLFSRSKLTVPSKGVLLFGPPGTGKTMVAKAIATSVRASFLCVSASTVTSKWVGEGEKYAAAVFGLASKIAPCIVFIDEIDALLSKRGDRYEHESSRKIKNEIMAAWDGMHSHEQVMVIGATNRPQDLDEAVLRRLNRRLLVDLPDKQCRVEILKVLLADEKLADDVSLEDIASNTPGYTGSDLRNLGITAAYRPIKRYLKENPVGVYDPDEQDDPFVEKEMRMLQEGEDSQVALGCIAKDDFTQALKVVAATVHEDAPSVEELRRWNDMYGEQGSRRAGNLPYFM